MQELSTIKKFNELVVSSAKTGKKTINLDYVSAVALLAEINSILLDKVSQPEVQMRSSATNMDGGRFKN
jgi:hypothetical protein